MRIGCRALVHPRIVFVKTKWRKRNKRLAWIVDNPGKDDTLGI